MDTEWRSPSRKFLSPIIESRTSPLSSDDGPSPGSPLKNSAILDSFVEKMKRVKEQLSSAQPSRRSSLEEPQKRGSDSWSVCSGSENGNGRGFSSQLNEPPHVIHDIRLLSPPGSQNHFPSLESTSRSFSERSSISDTRSLGSQFSSRQGSQHLSQTQDGTTPLPQLPERRSSSDGPSNLVQMAALSVSDSAVHEAGIRRHKSLRRNSHDNPDILKRANARLLHVCTSVRVSSSGTGHVDGAS
jgi:hypothetical protein